MSDGGDGPVGKTVREATFDVFRQFGLTTIFANPGSTEISFLTGLPDDLEFVLALHESAVVGIATGYATASGRPALVNLHTTAGLGNAVGALATARTNRAPLVVIVGQQDRRHLIYRPFLAGDLAGLAGEYPVWVHQPVRPQDVPSAVARAWHEAVAGRGPALVIVPSDDWSAPADDVALAAPAVLRHAAAADPAAVEELAVLLEGARTPALVVGADADDADTWSALVELAERLQAPVWQEAFAARAGFPQDHPLFAGHLPAGRGRLRAALAGNDVVVAVGAPVFRQYPYERGPADRIGHDGRVDHRRRRGRPPQPGGARRGRSSGPGVRGSGGPPAGAAGGDAPAAAAGRRATRPAGARRYGQPTCWRRSPSGCPPTRWSSRRPRPAVPTCTACCPPRSRWDS